jgi:hypothetical protein
MTDSWISFLASLKEENCPDSFNPLIQSLWLEAKGDWNEAHEMVDRIHSQDAAWVHAFLHRLEGDISNADYWYSRAGRKRPNCTLEEERKFLVERLK